LEYDYDGNVMERNGNIMELQCEYNVGIQRGKFMGIVRMGWENLGMLWGPVCLLNVGT
jgi:hypothetical protein